MTTQQKIKQVLINLAEEDELPLDLNELDPSVFDECLIEYGEVEYDGTRYPVRNVDGLIFAEDSLLAVIWDHLNDEPKDDEAKFLDNTICYFLDTLSFCTKTNEWLIDMYENL